MWASGAVYRQFSLKLLECQWAADSSMKTWIPELPQLLDDLSLIEIRTPTHQLHHLLYGSTPPQVSCTQHIHPPSSTQTPLSPTHIGSGRVTPKYQHQYQTLVNARPSTFSAVILLNPAINSASHMHRKWRRSRRCFLSEQTCPLP